MPQQASAKLTEAACNVLQWFSEVALRARSPPSTLQYTPKVLEPEVCVICTQRREVAFEQPSRPWLYAFQKQIVASKVQATSLQDVPI